jgi:hypothetical protein
MRLRRRFAVDCGYDRCCDVSAHNNSIQREAAPQAHIKHTLYSTRSVPRAARTPQVLLRN